MHPGLGGWDLLVSNPFDPLKFCEIKEIYETSNDGIQVEMNSGFRFVCPNKNRGKTNQKYEDARILQILSEYLFTRIQMTEFQKETSQV